MPDIVVLKPRPDYYASESHTPEDTFFVVEVSETALRYDTEIKLPIYARTGVSEVWIENLREGVLLVWRDAAGKNYDIQFTLGRSESVNALAFPDVIFKVGDLLG